jgi:hypothetical protein
MQWPKLTHIDRICTIYLLYPILYFFLGDLRFIILRRKMEG